MVNEIYKRSTAENIIEQLNAKNAKKVALFLVLGFVAYHGMLHLRYGIDSCKWLLSDGRYKADQEWQPFGCMLHKYSHIDTRRCLRYLDFWDTHNHFVFIGDTRIYNIYDTFISHLQKHDDSITTETSRHSLQTDHNFMDAKLRVKVEYIYRPTISTQFVEDFHRWQKEKIPPSVIVAGCATTIIKESNASAAALKEYSVNLTRLVRPIDELKSKSNVRVLWTLQEPVNKDKMVDTFGQDAITNEQIDLYNKAAIEVLTYSSAELWWSLRLVAQGLLDGSPDGFHLGSKARQHGLQILLNMYCNDHMNFKDGSCCSSRERSTTLQYITFAVMGVCIFMACILKLRRWILQLRGIVIVAYTPLNESSQTLGAGPPSKDCYTLFTSLSTVSFIMFYFFLCDRTNFFMKENKYYSEFSFWIPVGYMCALGLFFTDDSRYTKVLHPDQTDESKGWMQLVILIYHMTGASRVLPIYMVVHLLISGYLFLAGFEHFAYTWKTGDFSIVRLFQVLFRFNFITFILCLCMNRPYQFYDFVPTLSFWYVMLYLLLFIPTQITAQTSENNPLQYLYLVIKFVGFFTFITILYMSEVFFEKVFVTRPWKALYVTIDDDIKPWWRRWKIDRYSISYGCVFAIFYLIAQRYNLVDDNNHSNLFPKRIALTVTLFAIIGIGSYTTFIFLCHNQLECEEIHSYISFVPIISYISIRNISGILRTRYSSLFAWFGRIYLELFISQSHIWLAADTHGVLVLIPNYPVLNVIVTSFIYVCASHELNRLTNVLLPYAVPSDWKLVLRNVVLFVAVLVPIGCQAEYCATIDRSSMFTILIDRLILPE